MSEKIKTCLIYGEYRVFYPVISYLPVSWAYKMATFKGIVDSYLYPEKVNDYISGLKLYGKIESSQHMKIAKAQLRMLAREKMDVYFLSKMNKKNINKYITVTGLDHYIEAMDDGTPVILYTAHFGRCIMPTIALDILGFNLTILTAPINGTKIEQWYLEKKISAMKAIIKGDIIHTNQSTRALYKIVKEKKETLAIAVDVIPAPDQAYYQANFLQGKVRFPRGIVKMAKKMDALLVPFFALEHEGHLSAEFMPAIATRDLHELDIFQLILQPIEEKVLMHPEQWWAWSWLSSFWKKDSVNA